MCFLPPNCVSEGAGEVAGGRKEQQQVLWAVPGLSLSLINYADSTLCIPNEEVLVHSKRSFQKVTDFAHKLNTKLYLYFFFS